MLIVRKFNAYLGIFLIVIGSFCPLLKVKALGIGLKTFNLFQTHVGLALITFVILAMTFFCLMVRKLSAFKFFSIVNLVWVILMAGAVKFKATHYLGKAFADNLIGKMVFFHWAWIVLLLGAFLLVTSTKKEQLKVEA